MREQDADLLECMHYAASQVSQYSPDGTPLLRPQDRSLPMEDVPLIFMPMASTSELLMKREDSENDNRNNSARTGAASTTTATPSTRTASFGSDFPSNHMLHEVSSSLSNNTSSSLILRSLHQSPAGTNSNSFGNNNINKSVHFPLSEASMISIPSLTDEPSNRNSQTSSHLQSPRRRDRYRRLLSGEVRPVPRSEEEEDDDDDDYDYYADDDYNGNYNNNRDCGGGGVGDIHGGDINNRQSSGTVGLGDEKEQEEGETTASPVSVAQEAATAKTEQEEGLAERRRMSEAIQFAQAVGEEISINRDDLCIIEDNEHGDDDDDDDDEAIEPKEIMVSSHHEHPHDMIGVSSHHHPDNFSKSPSLHEVTSGTVGSQTLESDLPKHVDIRSSSSHHHRRKSRPMWPFEQPTDIEFSLTEHLSGGVGDGTTFVYKGICANPPEITKRGIQRGNYAQLHRKAWLEVSDKYHRYGKNLRLYYRYWERLGFPTNQFFDWLDSKGEAAGQPLPNMEECPRSVLDSDTVLYITNPKVTDGYALDIVVGEDGRGRVIDVDGDPVLTGPDGWIFVLRDNVLYGAPKITSISGHSKQRFHHSSFFGGKAVASAGIIITDDDGYLTRLYPHSGHYRPGEAHMQRMLLFMHRKGVDLRTFEIDMQQLIHVSREIDDGKKKKKKGGEGDGKKEEKKMKKVDSLHLQKALEVACYLAHKADFIGKGIFDKVHKIRKADATSVTEALNLVDDGGYWKMKKAVLQGVSAT